MQSKPEPSKLALHTIYEISKILSSSLELGKTLHQVLNVISVQLEMQRGMISLADDIGDLHVAAASGFTQDEIRRGKFKSGEGVTGNIFRNCMPAVIPNVAHEPLFLNRTGAYRDLKDKKISFVGVPTRINRRCIGVLSFEREATGATGSFQNLLQLLTMVSRPAAAHRRRLPGSGSGGDGSMPGIAAAHGRVSTRRLSISPAPD
jgi:Nif-specific regulatory protein